MCCAEYYYLLILNIKNLTMKSELKGVSSWCNG